MGRFATALLAGLAYLALAGAAPAAEVACGDRQAITERLAAVYAESRVGIGLDSDGRMIEVFASRAGSWTMLVTFPTGETCLIATGEAWHPPPLVSTGPMT